MFSKSLLVGSLAVMANAIILDAPLPTKADYESEMSTGISPKPTTAPYVPHFDFLKKRQMNAESNTCGFVTGSAIYCLDGSACVTGALGGSMIQGCCDFADCNWFTTCYDYNAYTGGACSDGCLYETRAAVCSDTYLPSCQTYTFPNGVSAYGCDTDAASTATPMSTSYDGYVAQVASTAVEDAFNPAGTSTTYNFPINYHHGVSAVIPAVIVLVIYGLGYLAALIIIIMCCRKHKAFMRSLDYKPPTVVAAAPMSAPVAPNPVFMEQNLPQSNVVMPMGAGQMSQQQYGYMPVPTPTGTPAPQYYQHPHQQGYTYQ